MSSIHDRPLDYDAGLAFNYDVWTPGTTATLCNVNWDSTYRDVVLFPSKSARNAHMTASAHNIVVDKLSYARPGVPVRLSVPYSQAQKFNYMRVRNGSQPIGGDTATDYYYFVKAVRHVNPGVTEFVLQLDVWQSYIYDVVVRRGFLKRGHWAVVQSEADSIPRCNNYALVPEGMDTGDRYVTPETLTPAYSGGLDFYDNSYVISSTVGLHQDPGTRVDPKNPGSIGTTFEGIHLPTETWAIPGGDLRAYLNGMTNFPWITAGIFRIIAVPKLPTRALGNHFNRANNYPPGASGSSTPYIRPLNGNTGGASQAYKVPNWNWIANDIQAALDAEAGTSYTWFSKFHTFPYSYISLTDGAGNEIAIKPQYVRENHLRLHALTSFVPGNEAIKIDVVNYLDGARNAEASLIMRAFPALPALNDNAAIAQASTAHGTQSARSGAAWAQESALAGNANSYDNATIGLNAGADASASGRRADAAQTANANQNANDNLAPGAVSSIMGGAVGGAVGGAAGVAVGAGMGAASALTSAWTTANTTHAATRAMGIRSQASIEQQQIAYGAGAGVRDNNKSLGDWAAKGNYANAIGAINAKVQDTEMTPASLAGQYGGEIMAWAMGAAVGVSTTNDYDAGGTLGLFGRVKTVTRDVIARQGQQWARYGYACNRFINVGKLDLMTELTYWEFADVSIEPMPGLSEEYLNALRGILEKGVTVYNDPAKIMAYNLAGNRIK